MKWQNSIMSQMFVLQELPGALLKVTAPSAIHFRLPRMLNLITILKKLYGAAVCKNGINLYDILHTLKAHYEF